MNAEENGELPEGWTDTTLEECVDVLDNRRIPVNSDERQGRQGNVPYYGATGQVGWIDDFIFDEELVLLGEDGAPFFDKSKPIAYLISGKTWVNNHAHVLRALPQVTSNLFVKYFLDAFKFEGFVNGTTRLKLTKASLHSIPMQLPPLAEQQRIVAAVEAVLAKVNAARDRLNRVPSILKRFRQAVLSAACSGRLTADWREKQPAIESAGVLVRRIAELRETKPSEWRRFANRTSQTGEGDEATEEPDEVELPETWLSCDVEQIATVCLGGTPSRKVAAYWGGDVLWVSSGEVANCRIHTTTEKITAAGLENSNAKVYPPGTVLIAMIGEGKTRGQTALLDVAASTNQNAAGLVFDAGNMIPEYVWLWALSVYETHRSGGRGGNYPALNGQIIKKFKIPVPPLAEQQEIVRRVGDLFALADVIEARLTDARQMANQLTQAVLAKAFRGELVPTEAALARREKRTYEPAADLLARIRAEREQPATTTTKPVRSRKPKPTS